MWNQGPQLHILDNNSQCEQLVSRDKEAQTNTVTVVPVAGDLIIAHSMGIASRFRVWYAEVCMHLWFYLESIFDDNW